MCKFSKYVNFSGKEHIQRGFSVEWGFPGDSFYLHIILVSRNMKYSML